MTTLKATVTGRRLEIDVPADWPDGTEVEIHPLGNGAADDESMTPEEVRGAASARCFIGGAANLGVIHAAKRHSG